MENKDFAVFILTHGRPDNVITYKTLLKAGYTGKIYIIIDNEDETANKYYENFGDKVIMFDKKAISDTFDEGDNFEDRRTIVYARNACFGIAEKLDITYFIQLDDDYTKFDFRINENKQIPEDHWIIKSRLDYIFNLYLEYYKSINAKSIAFAQGGDFISGHNIDYKIKRKCMNSFFCSTDRPFNFIGRINEDVNTYTFCGSLGNLFFTIPCVKLDQKQTQSNSGGMTDLYLDSGTYIKSFYTIMYQPSSVKIRLMGTSHKRLHHSISWKNTVPVILDETYKKIQ